MTRKDLAKILAKKTNLSFREAENLIIAFGAVVSDALAKGDKIVYSNFGSFYTVHYPSKVIYHPKLGAAKKMIMLPTNATKWMPSGNIKEMVNSGKVVENVTVHGKKKTIKQPVSQTAFPLKVKRAAVANTAPKPDEEEVVIPIRTNSKPTPAQTVPVTPPAEKEKKVTNSSLNIYEELMNDGSKIESTFGDAIRLPRKENIFNRILGKKKVDEVAAEKPSTTKVSLVGAGIFDNISAKESPAPAPTSNETLDQAPLSAPTQSEAQPQDLTPTDQTPKDISADPHPYDPYNTNPSILNNNEQPDNLTEPDLSSKPKEEEEALPIAEQKPTDKPKNTKDIEDKDLVPFPITKNTVSYIDLAKTVVPKEILQKIPERIARKYRVVPISEKDGSMDVAMIDPEDIEAREIIKKYIQEKIVIHLTTEDDLSHILDQYSALESELESALETADSDQGKEKEEVDKAQLIESASDNAPAARIVSSLLRRAIREKASDLHIEPAEDEVEVRFRLDGILKKTASLPKDIQSAVISRIKILSNLKIDEQRMPQDGRFSMQVDNRRVDFRISTMPVAYGEKVVMRVLDKVSGILTIEQLGIRGSGLEALKNNIEKSHGMTLVTGPTGSGKTTTLYALIERIYNESINIITLEDPIEYRMPGINQSQVNPDIDYTFASGLRSIVRQDPDVIMIGEIRDPETAEMAVHAALTGHIVLSTLHTNDSAGAAPRMMDMGVEPFLLTSSLNCVVGQRLARKICEDCKEEYTPSETELKEIKEITDKLPAKEKSELKTNFKLSKGKGCKTCANTGYKGRLGVYEVLDITEEIKEMILQKQSSYKIQEKAIEQGMVTMIQDGILKALDGITTLEEVWRVIKE